MGTAANSTADSILFVSQADMNTRKNKLVSTIISIAAHIAVFGLIKTVHFTTSQSAPVEEQYIDLGYQQFDEVPEIVNSAQPVVKNETVVQDKSEPVESKTQEMQDQSSDVAGLQKEVTKPTTTTNTNTTTVPYYKIKPKYPKDALESNIEGHVLLKIDILEDGSVENIQVTGGEKTSFFETAAMRAVAKWKYKAFLDELGHPTKKRDYQVRVDFKIKDELQTSNY